MSTNILDMVRDSLRFDLQASLTRATAEQREHVSRPVALKRGDQSRLVRISARPFVQQGLMWVVFEDVETGPAPTAAKKAAGAGESSREAELLQNWSGLATPCRQPSKSCRRPTRNCVRPTKNCNRSMRSTKAPMRNWKARRRNCSRLTKSWSRSILSSAPRSNRRTRWKTT